MCYLIYMSKRTSDTVSGPLILLLQTSGVEPQEKEEAEQASPTRGKEPQWISRRFQEFPGVSRSFQEFPGPSRRFQNDLACSRWFYRSRLEHVISPCGYYADMPIDGVITF